MKTKNNAPTLHGKMPSPRACGSGAPTFRFELHRPEGNQRDLFERRHPARPAMSFRRHTTPQYRVGHMRCAVARTPTPNYSPSVPSPLSARAQEELQGFADRTVIRVLKFAEWMLGLLAMAATAYIATHFGFYIPGGIGSLPGPF